MVVNAGKAQSLVIQGEDKFIRSVESKVVNGTLVLSFPKNYKGDVNSDSRILITVLKRCARSTSKARATPSSTTSAATASTSVSRAPSKLVAKGSVKLLKLQAQGVGDVDTKDLKAERADVSFEGIGAVKVHASDRLDAVVQGMGSLAYYGNPKTVNKTVEGIGSVKSVSR
ncbi:DUF2807 domain-containing protein [Massilia sp. B-10]|nr:DUF2807 domain-containing protein [Massilia sp. B-10]